MARARHTVSIRQADLLLEGARRRGRDPAAALAKAGIPAEALAAPSGRVTLHSFARLQRTLERELRDELWGLCARPVPPGAFASVCRAAAAQPTLGAGLRLGFRLYAALIPDFRARVLVEGGEARLRAGLAPGASPGAGYAARVFLFFAYGLACWAAGERIPLRRVRYREARPVDDIDRMFGAPVLWGQPAHELAMDAVWLDRSIVRDRAAVEAFLPGARLRLLARYEDPDALPERVRRLLAPRLAGPPPTLDEVARALALSPQTLRRRLAAEGASFAALRAELRRDAAIELLGRPDLRLSDVAAAVGFSDVSTFHRAFKGWTGMTPGDFRHRG